MSDFWKDYNPSSNEEIPSMRGIDYERIKAYCKAIGVDMYKQSINAKFMNEMEDWYLSLAKQSNTINEIKTIVAKWETDIWRGALLSYESMTKISDLLEESEETEP